MGLESYETPADSGIDAAEKQVSPSEKTKADIAELEFELEQAKLHSTDSVWINHLDQMVGEHDDLLQLQRQLEMHKTALSASERQEDSERVELNRNAIQKLEEQVSIQRNIIMLEAGISDAKRRLEEEGMKELIENNERQIEELKTKFNELEAVAE